MSSDAARAAPQATPQAARKALPLIFARGENAMSWTFACRSPPSSERRAQERRGPGVFVICP